MEGTFMAERRVTTYFQVTHCYREDFEQEIWYSVLCLWKL